MTLLGGWREMKSNPGLKNLPKKGCETWSEDSKMGITLNEIKLSKSSGQERFFLGLASFLYKVQNLICF
jgi:hypothetical protein